MDVSQMIENFQALLLQTEKRQGKKRRQEAEESETRRRLKAKEAEKQDEKSRQEK